MRTVIGMSWNGTLQAILHSAGLHSARDDQREIPPNVVDEILRRSRELNREAEIKEEEIRLLKKSLRRMAQKQEQASASSATSMALAVAVMGIVTSTVTTSSRMARMRRERLAAAAEFVTAIEIYDSVKRPAVDVPFFIQASEQARLFREAMSKLEASDDGADEALAASLLEILKVAVDALEREKAQASPTMEAEPAAPSEPETTKNPWSDILRLASDTMPTLLAMYLETQARSRAKRRHEDDALKAADRLALVLNMLTENFDQEEYAFVTLVVASRDYYTARDREKEAAATADDDGGTAIAEAAEAVAKAAESVDEQGSPGRVTAKKAKKRHIRHAAILDDGAVVGSGHETAGSTPEDAGS